MNRGKPIILAGLYLTGSKVPVKDRSGITNGKYRKMFGISDGTALRDLTVICEKRNFSRSRCNRERNKIYSNPPQTRHIRQQT